MTYQDKYLKYKNKYIALKNALKQKGGSINEKPVTPPHHPQPVDIPIPNSILYNAYKCIPWNGNLRYIDPKLSLDKFNEIVKNFFYLPLLNEEQKNSWNITEEQYNDLIKELSNLENCLSNPIVTYNALNGVSWEKLKFVDPKLHINKSNSVFNDKLPNATYEQKKGLIITKEQYNAYKSKLTI